MAHVVVLGGGFGGVAAANELARRLGTAGGGDEHQITLVDRRDRFFMGFAKLWDLAGVRPLAQGTASLGGLSRRGVRFVHAEVTSIDAASRHVETSAGPLDADGLVIALGTSPHPAHTAMLDGPRAHNLYDPAELPAMRSALDAIERGRVAIALLGGPFPCPPAPFEAALLVDERLRNRGVRDVVGVAISTFQPATLPVAGPDASAYVARHLADHGVDLYAPKKVTAVDHDHGAIRFDDGDELGFDLLLGVPAVVAPDAVKSSGVAGEDGWIRPDRETFATSAERVYAVGDSTMVPTATGMLPKAGVFAAAAAEVAAANLARDLTGEGERATFDGHGFCFLELPGHKVAFVEGDFYADPPAVQLTEASEEQFARKQAFERERLDAWLG